MVAYFFFSAQLIYLFFFFQLKIEQRDGTPLTGRREDVNVSARVTYMLPELESTPYPWYYPARNYMDLPNKIYSVPDSGLGHTAQHAV